MPKAEPDHRRFFEEMEEVEQVARFLLPGDPPRGRLRAARALAELAADRGRISELLRALPGGALAALALVVEGRHPLPESVLIEMIDAALGKGRGAAAFRAALGSGLLAGLDQPGRARRVGIWPPFEEPLRALLAGVQLVERPDPEGPVPPDRGAFAFAVLLGQLAQRAPRRTADGPSSSATRRSSRPCSRRRSEPATSRPSWPRPRSSGSPSSRRRGRRGAGAAGSGSMPKPPRRSSRFPAAPG